MQSTRLLAQKEKKRKQKGQNIYLLLKVGNWPNHQLVLHINIILSSSTKFSIISYAKKVNLMNSSKLNYWKCEVKTFLDLTCFNELSSWFSNCWTSFRPKPSSCSPSRCLKFEESEVVGCIYLFFLHGFSFFVCIWPLVFLNRFNLGLELVIFIAPIFLKQ